MQTVNTAVSHRLTENLAEYARTSTLAFLQRHPGAFTPGAKEGRMLTLVDYHHHLGSLAAAIRMERHELLNEHLEWASELLDKHGVPGDLLTEAMDCLRATLSGELTPSDFGVVDRYLNHGLLRLAQAVDELESFVNPAEPHFQLLRSYVDALLKGDKPAASRMILDAVEAGTEIRDIYLHVFQKAQYEMGRLWQMNRITVGQEHYFTAATQSIMSQLYPKVFSTQRNGMRMVAACVGGNLHELGLRMIADFFELEGWDTYYLGADTPADSIVSAVIEKKANVLAISATLSSQLEAVSELIQEMRSSSAASVSIMVGGAPFNSFPGLWRKVGADAYAKDAEGAVQAVKDLSTRPPR